MIVYAVNINKGGGKVLLDELIINQPYGEITTLFLDVRYIIPAEFNLDSTIIYKVKPQIIYRLLSEYKLFKLTGKNTQDVVLRFGNLPSLFRLKSRTILFLQNAFLLKNVAVPRDTWRLFLRTIYEKIWFKLFINNTDEIWVQTKWMKNSLSSKQRQITKVQPLIPTLPSVQIDHIKTIDFLAITGTIKYKNLIPLLHAIKKTANSKMSIVIISDSHTEEIEELLKDIRELKINLTYLVDINRDDVWDFLSKSRCLILTSELESFCLPLHEAMHFKLDIIAGEFPFITEYVVPTISLKEMSPDEISHALMLYFLKKRE